MWNSYITKEKIGGYNCYQMYGISYYDEKAAKQMKMDIDKVYKMPGGKEKYWDNVPLTVCKKDFKVEVRECKKSHVTEIDNYSELVIIDPSYKDYKTKM